MVNTEEKPNEKEITARSVVLNTLIQLEQQGYSKFITEIFSSLDKGIQTQSVYSLKIGEYINKLKIGNANTSDFSEVPKREFLILQLENLLDVLAHKNFF